MSKRGKKILIGIAVFAAVLVCALTGAVVYLHTNHAGMQIQSRVSERIPGRIAFKEYSLSLKEGRIELGNVLIRDDRDEAAIGIERLAVRISLPDLLKKSIKIEEVYIKDPQVRLLVYPNGDLNVVRAFVSEKALEEPQAEEKSEDGESPYNIVLKSFHLENGEISFQDPSRNTSASLKSIVLSSSGNLEEKTWRLNLSAEGGEYVSADVEAAIDFMKLKGILDNENLEELQLEVKTDSSDLKIAGSARTIFTGPVVDLSLNVALNLFELGEALSLEQDLAGTVTGGLTAKGPLENPEAAMSLQHSGGKLAGYETKRIDLKLFLNNQKVRLDPLNIAFESGYLKMDGESDLGEVFPEGFLSPPKNFDSLSYDLQLVADKVRLKSVMGEDFADKGQLNGEISLEGKGISPERAFARYQMNISGKQVSTGDFDPIDISVESLANLDKGEAVVEKLEIEAGPASLSAKGRYSLAGREIEADIKADAPDLAKTLSPLGIDKASGSVNLLATASGTLGKPLFDLFLNGQKVGMEQFDIGDFVVKAVLDESGVLRISKLNLENQGSEIKGEGIVKLFENGDGDASLLDNIAKVNSAFPIDLNLTVKNVEAFDFLSSIPVSGTVDGEIRAEGDLKDLKAELELAAQNLSLEKNRIGNVDISAKLSEGEVSIEKAALKNNRSAMEVSGTLGVFEKGGLTPRNDPSLDLALRSDNLYVQDFTDRAKAKASLRADIKGTFENPAIQGDAAVENLIVNDRNLGDFTFDLQLDDYVAKLSGRLNFDVDATYHLKKKDFSANFDFSDTDLSPYFNLADMKDFSGRIRGRAQATGNASKLKEIEGFGDFQLLHISRKDQELAHAENFSILLKDRAASVSGLDIQLLRKGNLSLEGDAALDGALSFKAEGKIPLEGLKEVTDFLPDISGMVEINANVQGSAENPDVQGEITLDNVGFTVPELLQKVHGLNGRITITPESLQIEKIRGKLDSGRFDLNGQVKLDDFSPGEMKIDFAARALPIKAPDTLDLLLQSDLTFSGTLDNSLLAGEVIVLEGVYYKDVKTSILDTATKKKRTISPKKQVEPDPMLENIKLDISVKRRNPFLVDNNLAYLDINPDIRITGTAADPAIRGRTTIESGTIRFQGKEFKVQKGVIDFVNPYELEPALDIVSTVNIRRWLITLTVSGTPENLVFELSSNPPEEDGDILSLLLLGKTTGELIGQEGGSKQSAEQMLAEVIATTLGEDIKKMTGLDYLEVETDPLDESETDPEGVKVTVGKNLSERLTVKYSVDSRTGEMVQRAISEYKLLENIILSAFQDSEGDFGGEIQYKLEFR